LSTSPQVAPQTAELVANAVSQPAWKQEVNARLSAHRSRRGAFLNQQPALPGLENSLAPAERAARPAARVAARVAERYAKVPTYSELLAAEAEKAARAAEAAAYAAQQAHQAAQAVTDVLWAGVESGLDAQAEDPATPSAAAAAHPPQYRVDPASLPAARRSQPSRSSQPQSDPHSDFDPHPHIFDPFEDALVAPAQPLPARVLEFPRELVAARKARPRAAEGPLRDAALAGPENAQLRIFEVETEAISHQPIATAEQTRLPEWSSMRLDATPRNMPTEASAASETVGESMRATPGHADSRSKPFSSRAPRRAAPQAPARRGSVLDDVLPLHVAPIEDRLMAAIVDAALVLCAFLLFVLVFAACTIHPPTGRPAMATAGAALVGLAALYQWLFFTYAESTPGMRYAKIALCTFDDENPGRKTLQRRVGALFLAALPLGLGFLWALLDEDRLGWHDRMTRTYQRSYR
jgi:uncharacterized RDD family membrane protein YckC